MPTYILACMHKCMQNLFALGGVCSVIGDSCSLIISDRKFNKQLLDFQWFTSVVPSYLF